MSKIIDVTLTVNGERVSRRVEARRHLVDFLRLELGLMGTHTGCEHGICGACTVRVDGKIVRGCLVLAALSKAPAWRPSRASPTAATSATCRRRSSPAMRCQCGYCTPGMLLTAADLLASKQAADAGADPRASVRQLLPLHRLSRHRRCRRATAEKRSGKAGP